MFINKFKYVLLVLLFIILLIVLEYCYLTIAATIYLFLEPFGIVWFVQWWDVVYCCLIPALITDIFILWYYCEYFFITSSSIPFKYWNEYYTYLSAYMEDHKAVNVLENKNLRLYMNDFGMGMRIRILNKINNKMFELAPVTLGKSSLNDLTTVWGVIQMNFNDNITYRGLYAWCRHMNYGKFRFSRYK